MPRRPNDFEPLDAIYEALDKTGASGATAELAREKPDRLKMDADRKPRTEDEMEREASESENANSGSWCPKLRAEWLAQFFPDEASSKTH